MAATHDKEKQLTREIAPKVERAVPGTEVLAVELTSPERFTVYVDHVQGVDHALCARVTSVLGDYLGDYSIDVSSPVSSGRSANPPIFETSSAAASHCGRTSAIASAGKWSPQGNPA